MLRFTLALSLVASCVAATNAPLRLRGGGPLTWAKLIKTPGKSSNRDFQQQSFNAIVTYIMYRTSFQQLMIEIIFQMLSRRGIALRASSKFQSNPTSTM
jgi:hypothetical protein